MSHLLSIRGLVTYKNPLNPPEGGLNLADNIVIDEPSVAEPRRGFKDWGDSLPAAIDRIGQLFVYKDRIFRYYNSTLEFSDLLGNFTAFIGTYDELESGLRPKNVEANGNFYFTSTEGIKKISALTSADFTAGMITNAGGLKALDFELSADGTTGWLEADYQVAYRVVWGTKDRNSNLILGSPSGRVIYTNNPTTTHAITLEPDVTGISVSFNSTTELVTSPNYTPANDDIIYFTSIGSATGISINTQYYVVNQSGSTFQLSTTQGGLPLNITANGDGDMIAVKSLITLTSHGFSDGDIVYFKNIIGTTDISSVGANYYVVNSTLNTFQISTTTGGSYITFQTSGSATLIARSENPPVDIELSIQVPAFATNQYFIQIYRTATVDTTLFQAGITDGAGDEMQLVDEIPYDGTSNPVITVDRTLEEFQAQGDYLYTNQISGEGILQANDRPPIAKDVALFRNSTFFANTKTSHKYNLSLLSSTDLDTYSFAIGNSNVVRIYTFSEYDSSTDPNPSIVTLTGGTIGADIGGSPAQNIDQTARNLIKIINQDSSNPVTASYTSTDSTLPGMIFLENDILTDLKFYVCVDNVAISGKFNPDMPVINPITTTSIQTSTQFSDNENAPNRIYFSKFGKPEAVPTVNYIDVGTKDKAIYRILALRDSLFALKEDGVFIITGSSAPNFSVRLLDNSAPIIAPDSAAILNNKIYCLATQGIIEITETGIQVRSFNIENLIRNATKEGMDYKYTSVGVGYENDRSYLLWLPTKIGDTVATQCLRYNTFTDTWVRWTISATAAVVNVVENKMYLGAGDRNNIYQERKTRTRFDYADREFEVGILDANSLINNDVILNTINNVEIHDALVQTQYITISFFNRLLKKLDFDPGLADNDYFSTLELIAGDNLRTKLQALDTKLQNDANIGTYTPVTFSADFQTQQTELNSLISQLNGGLVGTVFKNYRTSVGNVYWESIITATETFSNRVTLQYALPLLYGTDDPVMIYKAIPSTIQWTPQHFGAADKLKQVSEGTIIIDKNNFVGAELQYKSDLSQSFDSVPVTGRGTGVWGMQPWGEFIWGGEGNDAPFRTFIPRDKQRCRYLTVQFFHSNARNLFRLIGISLVPREISYRGYR